MIIYIYGNDSIKENVINSSVLSVSFLCLFFQVRDEKQLVFAASRLNKAEIESLKFHNVKRKERKERRRSCYKAHRVCSQGSTKPQTAGVRPRLPDLPVHSRSSVGGRLR